MNLARKMQTGGLVCLLLLTAALPDAGAASHGDAQRIARSVRHGVPQRHAQPPRHRRDATALNATNATTDYDPFACTSGTARRVRSVAWRFVVAQHKQLTLWTWRCINDAAELQRAIRAQLCGT